MKKNYINDLVTLTKFLKKIIPTKIICITLFIITGFINNKTFAQFTAGRLVVIQTSGATSKAGSAVSLNEYSTAGVTGTSIAIAGANPLQMAAGAGGSEGFLTRSANGAFLMLGGYGTSASFPTDITTSTSSTTPRVIFRIDANGTYTQVGSSTTNYNANDIRGAISDGIIPPNYWASGASVANIDGVDYYGPGTAVALGTGATPVKVYGLRIFNGQIYYSTQKAGPNNTSAHLGIFSLGTGMPTSGTPTSTQIIDVGATAVPADFSFNPTGDTCYIAINLNTALGGIQKWTKSGGVWTMSYLLGTGATNVGAYGLTVDYSGVKPVIYATTFEANTTGNRIIKITDTGSGATATTLVTAAANTWFHGIDFAPVCTPVSISSLTSNGPVCEGNALNLSLGVTGTGPLSYAWTGPNSFTSSTQSPSIAAATIAATGSYSVTITNSCGTASSNISTIVNSLPAATITPNGTTTFCAGSSVTLNSSAGSSYIWSNGGSTSQALVVTSTGNYTVTVTDANNCSATSSPVSVTVNPVLTTSVSIAANPGITICSGTNVVFTATPVNGGTSPSYQWKLNNNNTGSNSDTYSNNSLSNGDIVSCVLTSNETCPSSITANSNTLTIQVTSSVVPSVSIASGSGTTNCAGVNVTFTATPVYGGASPAYQWLLNNNNVGTNSATYSNNALTDQDVVSCVMTSSNGCALPNTVGSNALTMTVTPVVTPSVTISASPGTVICSGTNATFTAVPVNGGTPFYQWTKNGNAVGTNSAAYADAALVNNDQIVCTLTSSLTCTTTNPVASTAISMTINALPTPSITGTLSFCSGGSTTLDAGAGYTSYTWSPNGESSQTISASSATAYSVTVSNGNCSAASSPVTVSMITAPSQPAAFTVSTANVNKGQSGVSYTVPNDVTATAYNWSYSGTGSTINGTNNSITVDFSSTATAGNLSVTAGNTCGTSTSRTLAISINPSSFTAGRIVVLQTNNTASKVSSPVTLTEYTTSGVAGASVSLPVTGSTPIQTAGVFGGSEGFLTTSADGKFLVLAGYGTSSSFADITGTASATIPRVVATVSPSGAYTQVASSNTFYSLNDIRGAVSDGTNYWASGASASSDGIDYFGPSTQVALGSGATPVKAYGLRIFNGELYYSTQKAGPANSATQLGIFSMGNLPTTGTVSPTQIINTGSLTPEDFSFNPASDVCYVSINSNTSQGGIQKWTKSAGVWSLAYTLGLTNIGAYGLVVDYSGTNPLLYATTFESAGNRIIAIADVGAGSSVTTLVPATTGVIFHGIAFAPVASGTPTVTLSVSTNTGSETAATAVTVTANASFAVTGDQTLTLNVSGTGITAGDYTLSNTTITIPNGAVSGSVTFTVVDDAVQEGNETATLSISNPSSGIVLGGVVTQSVAITDNDADTPPSIVLNVSTSDFIDGGVNISPVSPYGLSGVINDPTDPVSTLGINFTINDIETAATSLTVTVASSNTSIVTNANVVLTGTGASRNVKITPSAIGYSNITVSVSDGVNITSYVINYAASIASTTPATTFWHTGMSDASDGIVLDDNYFISGDDELDVLNVYSRSASGLPLVSYNYASNLALPDPSKPEVDVEAATRSSVNTNRIYWTGSMSNGKSPFDNKPNRDRLFATTVAGTGSSTTFTTIGYCNVRTPLLSWGDTHGYNFTASAAQGVDSKSISGFAVEGMVFGPDNTTLYIAMRAPLVPTTARTKALIVPILNFETWFNNGTQSGNPSFGSPIELDMGGRGFRDIIRLSNGTYIIVAGNPGGSPITSALYKWTGNAADAPIAVNSSVSGVLNLEGVMQVNVSGQLSLTKLQLISDGGGDILYNDGTEAKDFSNLTLRKFRSDIVSSLDLTMGSTPTEVASAEEISKLNVFPNPFGQQLILNYQLAESSSVTIELIDFSGRRIALLASEDKASEGNYQLSVNTSDYKLSNGLYTIRFVTEKGTQLVKLSHIE